MNNEAIKKIADTYGYDTQSRQLIEEMAELTQAINKYWRKHLKCENFDMFDTLKGSPEEDAIIEEIADVEICLSQLKFLLGIRQYEIEQIIDQKLNRQLERIEKNE
jgi:NTP pyrophosphatase (non-canonical NTP hydrolase)